MQLLHDYVHSTELLKELYEHSNKQSDVGAKDYINNMLHELYNGAIKKMNVMSCRKFMLLTQVPVIQLSATQ